MIYSRTQKLILEPKTLMTDVKWYNIINYKFENSHWKNVLLLFGIWFGKITPHTSVGT